MNKEIKLSVKDLKISFRTDAGKVQAVRNISFDLCKGETLAIVGESGSGKSVTSKAIMGISAVNAINEGGEIIYDGQDLLKISEEDFHKIRGDKIAMIFQDPMSSLNPIMRIGRQLTEAMLLKGKARQKASRRNFNSTLQLLRTLMADAVAKGDQGEVARLSKMCENFDKFEFKHIELESAYKDAYNNAQEAISEIDNILFLIEKNALTDVSGTVKRTLDIIRGTVHTYVVAGNNANTLMNQCKAIADALPTVVKTKNFTFVYEALKAVRDILGEALEYTEPNFFCMGYYLTFSGEPLPELPVDELNAFLRKYLDDNFMLEFIDYTARSLEYSANISFEKKAECLKALRGALARIKAGGVTVPELENMARALVKSVNDSIDRVEIIKDSTAYTFESSINAAVSVYVKGIKKNKSIEAKHAKETAKYQRYIEKKGKEPDWKPTPLATVDLDLAMSNIMKIIERLIEAYDKRFAERDKRNYNDEAVAVIDYLKSNASGVVAKVTRSMAKHRALKLMEEVGIPEPRRRYRQYPFEFSGGMRQRIVIAIALAADPDILICDEPTTALDVTIQAQILELINKLKREHNLSIIFITHDLGVVANMADRIAVMYAGKIVEMGTAEDVFYDPRHPYTWALLSSMPDLDTKEKLEAIPGTPPNMIYPPVGDAFAARNKYALKIDYEMEPPMFEVSDTHTAATWLLHPNAPKVEVPKIITERIKRMKERGDNHGE